MRVQHRRSTPKVKQGKVQPKNRRVQSPDYIQISPIKLPIIKQQPGKGYKHLVTVKEMSQFLEIIPGWQGYSKGLKAIVLSPGNNWHLGQYGNGVIYLDAWNKPFEKHYLKDFVEQHRVSFYRLGVPCVELKDDYLVKFNETSARGFQLMHVFLHELGHHVDLMTTKKQVRCEREEKYAEDFANRLADKFWENYFKVFGW